MLEPKATESGTSPLLTQQLLQPQQNPCVLTTAHSSSLLCRPGQQILWSSSDLTQIPTGSTYHSCEYISSRELFWACHI